MLYSRAYMLYYVPDGLLVEALESLNFDPSRYVYFFQIYKMAFYANPVGAFCGIFGKAVGRISMETDFFGFCA